MTGIQVHNNGLVEVAVALETLVFLAYLTPDNVCSFEHHIFQYGLASLLGECCYHLVEALGVKGYTCCPCHIR